MKTVKTQKQAEANKRFDDHMSDIRYMLNDIETVLADRKKAFDRDGNATWPQVGDLGHVSELVEEIHSFLTDPDAR